MLDDGYDHTPLVRSDTFMCVDRAHLVYDHTIFDAHRLMAALHLWRAHAHLSGATVEQLTQPWPAKGLPYESRTRARTLNDSPTRREELLSRTEWVLRDIARV